MPNRGLQGATPFHVGSRGVWIQVTAATLSLNSWQHLRVVSPSAHCQWHWQYRWHMHLIAYGQPIGVQSFVQRQPVVRALD